MRLGEVGGVAVGAGEILGPAAPEAERLYLVEDGLVLVWTEAAAEVSVAGIPDAKQGEAVKAWVVLAAGKTVTAEEIQAWCKEKLVGYKIPKYVDFRSDLPKTMVGKVLRRVLQEEETAKNKK